ncbi:unnamed protein product [Caenorhabditis angaria]|uniref:K Homology domain-containing protein n=1 Tax=Caenorhabditis angaria TaxID=860376 RepID=A0A9P1I284_9PELO|nr:unnamed protein product [Caenorhabditis angaria]
MQSCQTPTFDSSTQLIGDGTIESTARSTMLTPTSLDSESPRKSFANNNSERWNTRRDHWSSIRAPPPANLTIPTSQKTPFSPPPISFNQTPNSLFSPPLFNSKSRQLFSPPIPSTPLSYGKNAFDKQSVFSTATTTPGEPIEVEASVEYLAELVKEKKHLMLFPHMFNNVERLLDEEIARVRLLLFQTDFPRIDLPEPAGDLVSITEKIYVPKNDYPDYNFVGRILGPRGMTAKQLEQDTGCKIMVRGKGSMRDKSKENTHRGKTNWEHLDDELHVLVQCEDTENRVHLKLEAAIEQVNKLLVPAPEGTDELKRKQLMELAIINGTYRPMKSPNPARIMTAVPLLSPSPLRTPASVMMSPNPNTNTASLVNPNTAVSTSLFDYPLLSPSVFDAFGSLQIQTEFNFPKYPTTTAFVNSFPSLFSTSSNSTNSVHTTSAATTVTPTSATSSSHSSF